MAAAYTWIDYVIILIFFLSILAGFGRGFIKEAISLVTLIAAFVVSITFSQALASWLNGLAGAQYLIGSLAHLFGESQVTSALSLVTLGISFFLLFVLTMVIGGIINRIASGVSAIPGIGFVNRILGAGFGAIRGYLFTVVVLFLFQFTAIPQTSAWMQSQYASNFQPAIIWLANIVSPGMQALKDKVGQTLEDMQPNNGSYNGT